MNLLLFLLAFANPGFEFLRLPAFVGAADATVTGVNAVWANPAGLVDGQNGVQIFASRWLLDHKYTNLSFKWANFGLKVRYQSFGEIEFHTDKPEDDLVTNFEPYAIELGIGYGKRLDPELSVGLELSWFYNRIYEHAAKNYLLSAGLIYKPLKLRWVSFGFSVLNFGVKTGYVDITYTMPTEVLFTAKFDKGRFMGGVTSKSVVTYKTDRPLRLEEFLDPNKNPGASIELFGGAALGDMDISVGYLIGNEALPLNLSIDYKVGKVAFAYGYRLGRLGFNSPISLSITMEF